MPTPSRRRVLIFLTATQDSTSTTSRCFFDNIVHYYVLLMSLSVKIRPFVFHSGAQLLKKLLIRMIEAMYFITLPPGGVRSIAISMSVCGSV